MFIDFKDILEKNKGFCINQYKDYSGVFMLEVANEQSELYDKIAIEPALMKNKSPDWINDRVKRSIEEMKVIIKNDSE